MEFTNFYNFVEFFETSDDFKEFYIINTLGSMVNKFYKCKNYVIYGKDKNTIKYSLYEFNIILERMFKLDYFITDNWDY